MAARHVGRRIGTVSSQHRAAERRRRSTPAAPHRVQRGKRETLTPGERRHLIQLVACGSIFVLLVAVKLLLPGRMAQVNAKLTGMLEQNIDVQAVFSAVGRAVSGEADVDVALQDMYQAVFDPQEDSAVEVSAPAGGEAVSLQLPAAIAPLRAFRTGTGQQRRLAGSARSSIPDGRDRADSRGRSDSGDCGNRIPGRGGGVYPGLRPLLRPEPAGQRVPGTGPAGL